MSNGWLLTAAIFNALAACLTPEEASQALDARLEQPYQKRRETERRFLEARRKREREECKKQGRAPALRRAQQTWDKWYASKKNQLDSLESLCALLLRLDDSAFLRGVGRQVIATKTRPSVSSPPRRRLWPFGPPVSDKAIRSVAASLVRVGDLVMRDIDMPWAGHFVVAEPAERAALAHHLDTVKKIQRGQ